LESQLAQRNMMLDTPAERDVMADADFDNASTVGSSSVAIMPADATSRDATRTTMIQTEAEYDGGGKVHVKAAQPSLPVRREAVQNALVLGDPSQAAQDRSMQIGLVTVGATHIWVALAPWLLKPSSRNERQVTGTIPLQLQTAPLNALAFKSARLKSSRCH
jgi:hypothetical protein